MTGDKLLTTPHRRSIRTSVLPHSVNVDVDVVISIYSHRVLLYGLN